MSLRELTQKDRDEMEANWQISKKLFGLKETDKTAFLVGFSTMATMFCQFGASVLREAEVCAALLAEQFPGKDLFEKPVDARRRAMKVEAENVKRN